MTGLDLFLYFFLSLSQYTHTIQAPIPNMKDSYTLPAAADMHVHLRDGDMLKAVVPTIRNGGVDTVYVMPNLVSSTTTYFAKSGVLNRHSLETASNTKHCFRCRLSPLLPPHWSTRSACKMWTQASTT